jgi:hypothetical protein
LAESVSRWAASRQAYVRALFFEYMVILGMLDVAYVPPEVSPFDMKGQWGTDDLSCLSRYDCSTCA